MAIPGIFASDRGIVGDRKGDFASALLVTHPTGSAPFFALTSGMQSADCSDVTITWFEENHISGRAEVATGGNSAAVSIVVDDGSSYVGGTILMVEETGEYILCSAASGNTLTIERGLAGTTAATISTGHHVQRIGTAFEEGSSRPTAVANTGSPKFNFTQIFRNAWDVTGTARRVQFHTTSDIVAKNRADCANFHAEDIERSLLFGRKSIGVRNNKPFRTMDGLNAFISTNVETTATMTWDILDAFLMDVYSHNIKGKPNERVAFCGNSFLSVIQKLAKLSGTIQLMVGATEFGMKVTKWQTPYGDLSLLTHPLLNENPTWSKDCYIFHPGAVRVRYLRRTQKDDYDANGSRAGVDADYGVMTTELSLEYGAEVTAAKYTGATGAA